MFEGDRILQGEILAQRHSWPPDHPLVDARRITGRGRRRRDRPCPPASLHQADGPRSRSRSVPDDLCTAARVGCGTDGRSPPDSRSCWPHSQARGVVRVEITLHVGYGTFQPVRVDRVEDHRLEPEHYEIRESAAAADQSRAWHERRRVIAVGTTTTRTLEAVAMAHDGRVAAGAGSTDLFIYPGFEFRVIGGLMTNFHLPRSSLLMLVSAFAGRERGVGRIFGRCCRSDTGSTATATRC